MHVTICTADPATVLLERGGGAAKKGACVQRRESVYLELKRLILDLELEPGSALTESELSDRLGASRTPIREAFQRLAHEGLVRLVPGRGAFVSGISVPDVVELFQMREALEPYAVRLAARSLQREGIDELLRELEDARDLIQGEESQAYYNLTTRIDAVIADMAGNQRLKTALDEVWTQIRRARRVSSASEARLLASVDEHIAILRAIAAGDEVAAEAAARVHVQRSLRHILSSTAARWAGGGLTAELSPTPDS